MKKSKTGQYNKRGTFRIPSGSTIVDGLEKANYVDGTTVWCGVIDIKGRQFYEAMAAQAENTIRFKMRYMAGVKDDWHFKVDNVEYEIKNIQDPGLRHIELILTCEVVS